MLDHLILIHKMKDSHHNTTSNNKSFTTNKWFNELADLDRKYKIE